MDPTTPDDDSPIDPAELAACVRTLARLRRDPMAFLSASTDPGGHLRDLRAEANRLIDAIRVAAAERRNEDPPKSTPKPSPAKPKSPSRPCYMCGRSLDGIGSSRREFCRDCHARNDAKVSAVFNVDNLHAVVTGGRTGIGFATACRLLRHGGRATVTTRFPFDAAERFFRASLPPAALGRLKIYGLDLRDIAAVERFARRLADRDPPQVLINNAAQTIRRPAAFYAALAEREQRGGARLPQSARLVAGYSPHLDRDDDDAVREPVGLDVPNAPETPIGGRMSRMVRRLLGTEATTSARPNAACSAMLATVPLLPGDLDAGDWLAIDDDGNALDLRPANTWTETIADVSLTELVETHCVNALAPFVLLRNLLPAMERSRQPKRFVINLAAAEGSFQINQGRGTHPHTNMAKASLNMLTRTLGKVLSARGVFMNSVDPGWVSDQRPWPAAQHAAATDGMRDVLTVDDAAARVTDPIVLGLASAEPPFGRLYRNFDAVPW